MLLIEKIKTHAELTSFRDHCAIFFKNELSLDLGERKLNEKVAKLIGYKDWNTAVGIIKIKESAPNLLEPDGYKLSSSYLLDQKHTCHRCGSGIDNLGFCEDTQCPYNDWKQDAPYIDNNDSIQFESPRRLRVIANAWTDDHAISVEMDATEYFHQLHMQGHLMVAIESLSKINFRGDYPSDEVALYFSDKKDGFGNYDIKQMFEYITAYREKTKKDMGFECAVDQNSLKAWIQQEAPELWGKTQSLFES